MSTHPRHTICPIGYYCPQVALDKIACDPAVGKYQDAKGSTECRDCPTGYYCT